MIRACQRLGVPNERTLLVGVRGQISAAGVEIPLPRKQFLVAGVEKQSPRRRVLAAGVLTQTHPELGVVAGVLILARRGQALAAVVEIQDRR